MPVENPSSDTDTSDVQSSGDALYTPELEQRASEPYEDSYQPRSSGDDGADPDTDTDDADDQSSVSHTGDDRSAGTDDDSSSPFSEQSVTLAKAYGFTEEDLKSFPSEQALTSALLAVDRRQQQFQQQLYQQLQQQQGQGQQQEQGQGQGQQGQGQGNQQQQQAGFQLPEFPEINLEDWEDHDEGTQNLVKSVAQMQEHMRQQSELIALQHQVFQQQYHQQVQQEQMKFATDFHDAVDALNDEMFGVSLDAKTNQPTQLNPTQSRFREALGQAYAEIYAQVGDSTDPKAIVKAAFQKAFPDIARKRDARAQAERARRQSKRRLGDPGRTVGRTAGSVTPADNDSTESLTRDPELSRLWEELGGNDR